MYAIFFVDVHRLHRQFAAQFTEHGGRLVPGCRVANQQGNIQFAHGPAQVLQVAQPEIHFARRVVVGQPLFWGDEVHGSHWAALAGGGQGGVVV